ncbi:MAG: sensor histidine kinase [Elusimicrobia bacterium]|nr:sensor histidine kinase [Elusimicrobiota bacterium]
MILELAVEDAAGGRAPWSQLRSRLRLLARQLLACARRPEAAGVTPGQSAAAQGALAECERQLARIEAEMDARVGALEAEWREAEGRIEALRASLRRSCSRLPEPSLASVQELLLSTQIAWRRALRQDRLAMIERARVAGLWRRLGVTALPGLVAAFRGRLEEPEALLIKLRMLRLQTLWAATGGEGAERDAALASRLPSLLGSEARRLKAAARAGRAGALAKLRVQRAAAEDLERRLAALAETAAATARESDAWRGEAGRLRKELEGARDRFRRVAAGPVAWRRRRTRELRARIAELESSLEASQASGRRAIEARDHEAAARARPERRLDDALALRAFEGLGRLLAAAAKELADSGRPAGGAEALSAIEEARDAAHSLSLIARPDPGPGAASGALPALREAVRRWEPAFRSRRILLARRWDARLAARVADREAFVAALHVLLRNAFEALPRGGKVTVSAEAGPDGRLAVAVADSGPGLPSGVALALSSGDPPSRAGRLGLGLPLARRLAARLGAVVAFRAGPAGGTVVTLEAAAPPAAGERP